MTARDDNPDRRMRRLRVDDYAPARLAAGPEEGPSHSGRRVVVGAGLALLLLWGALYLAFRDWRARYRERAAYGTRQVATAIDPMADAVPPGVDPSAWRRAVDETHAMLVTLTASNLLDLPQMRALRADVAARAARATSRPETARDELAALWDTLADRAGPIVEARHPRPKLLPAPVRPRRPSPPTKH